MGDAAALAHGHVVELRKAALTMALYVAISLNAISVRVRRSTCSR